MPANFELKARCLDLALTRERARAIATRWLGLDQQVDTYFKTAAGDVTGLQVQHRHDIGHDLVIHARIADGADEVHVATEAREILAENEDEPAVDRAVAGDHAVAENALQAE